MAGQQPQPSAAESRKKVEAAKRQDQAEKGRNDALASLDREIAKQRKIVNDERAKANAFSTKSGRTYQGHVEKARAAQKALDLATKRRDAIAAAPEQQLLNRSSSDILKEYATGVPASTAAKTAPPASAAQSKLGGPEQQSLAPETAAQTGGDAAARVIAAAESAIGVDYKWGGNNLATGVDCSGLVQQAFRAAGINMPRVSADQAKVGEQIADISLARPGDLLSWNNSDRNDGADHIAIYLGNGLMIDSPRPGEAVRVTAVRDGAQINRVLGVVEPRPGIAAPVLGPNTDRRYSTAVSKNQPAPTAGVVADTGGPMGGGVGDGLPPNATPAQVDAYIREHYADVAPFLANPEIKKLATDAAKLDLSPAEVSHRFQQTDYYKTHNAYSRQFDELLGSDNATAVQSIEKAKGIVADLWARNEVAIDDKTLGEVAKQAIRNGWFNKYGQLTDADGLNSFLSFTINAKGLDLAGEAKTSADSLKATAKEWGLTISDATAKDWALKILNGSATDDTFTAYVTGLARDHWHGNEQMVKAIDAGISPTKYFNPHQEAIASALGLSADQVDLFDPASQWHDVTDFWDPKLNGGKGGNRAMTVGEAAQLARNSPQYAETTAYKDTKASAAMSLVQALGLVVA